MLLAKATPNLAPLTSSRVNPLPNLNFLLYFIVCSLTIGLNKLAGLGKRFRALSFLASNLLLFLAG